MEEGKLDNLFLGIAQQIEGGVPDLLGHMFGFLARKTDFFTGGAKDQAKNLLLSKFEAARAIALKNQAEDGDRIVPLGSTKTNGVKIEEVRHNPEKQPTSTSSGPQPYQPPTKSDSGKLLPNKGNGMTFENYSWTQTLNEIEIIIPVKSNTGAPIRSRDVTVEFGKKKLKVQIKGNPPIIDGILNNEIKIEDSIWSIEDQGKTIRVCLTKIDKMGWCSKLLTDHEDIDTQKIVPADSKIDELDDETRAMVEKMMYDQKQKELGLPTSEEKSKQDMLNKFMKQHPEMDFSKAKIN